MKVNKALVDYMVQKGLIPPPAKQKKYKNKGDSRVLDNGVTYHFDSKKEARRFDELILGFCAGDNTWPSCQVKYHFVINGIDVGYYAADFVYNRIDSEGNLVWPAIVEDVKGVRTRVYNLKKRLLQATHGITITEV